MKLSRHIRVGKSNEGLHIGFGSQKTTFSLLPEQEDQLIEFLHTIAFTPFSDKDLKKKFIELLGKEKLDIFYELLSKNAITTHEYNKEYRYSRPSLYFNLKGTDPHLAQERISSAKVTILGAGGIGNIIGMMLASNGIGELEIIDGDTIEESNLTRQVAFNETDIGKLKAETLCNFLEKLNSKIKINYKNTYVKKGMISKIIDNETDLIVVSADQTFIMPEVNDFCVRNKVAHINIGYVVDIPIWGPFYIPGQPKCYSCLSLAQQNKFPLDTSKKIQEINSISQAPSFSPINNIAASFACNDIIDYLALKKTPLSYGRRLGININSLEFMEMKIDTPCKICTSKQK